MPGTHLPRERPAHATHRVSQYSAHCIVGGVLTLSTPLGAMNRIGRALADPTRCRILLALLDRPAYPSDLADELGLTRSNVSNHLACLRSCGIVVGVPIGRRTGYKLADKNLTHALRDLLEVVLAVDVAAPCVDQEPTLIAPSATSAGRSKAYR